MSKQIAQPSLTDILLQLKKDIFYTFNCHRVGIIQSFNEEEQTAKIQLVDKRVFVTQEGEFEKNYSLLIDCPVIVMKGPNGGLTIKIAPGAVCLVLFNDADLDNWFATGQIQKPQTPRSHDFSDGIAIIGLNSLATSIADYNNTATELDYIDDDKKKRGKIKLDSTALQIKYINADGVDQAQVSLDTLAEIKNATWTLKQIVDQFIDAVLNLQVTGNIPITATTTTALNTVKTNVAALLK